MSPLALGLILLSASLHATRDLFTKRSCDKQAFSWWYHVVGLVIMLPSLVWTARSGMLEDGWPYVVASGLVHAVYFYTLAEAYRDGDLSLVYPISRSSPLFVLLWAGLIWRESITPLGVLGVLLVAFGGYVLQMRRLSLNHLWAPLRALVRDRTIRLAWATALLVATYSLIDDRGVSLVSPMLYLVVYGAIGLAAYTPVVLWRHRGHLKDEWRSNWCSILAAGAISPSDIFWPSWRFESRPSATCLRFARSA